LRLRATPSRSVLSADNSQVRSWLLAHRPTLRHLRSLGRCAARIGQRRRRREIQRMPLVWPRLQAPQPTLQGKATAVGLHGSPAPTGARRGGPLLGRFLRPGHWLSLRGPGALAGGPESAHERDAAQPLLFRRRCPRPAIEIQRVLDATLCAPRLAKNSGLRRPVA